MRRCFILVFTTVLSVAAMVLGSDPAETATVISVPGDYASIQAALNAAVEGDTVVVAPGTYIENLDFRGKAVELRSAQGPESTIIDGGFAGRVVTFQSGETTHSVVRGFTLRHGVAGEVNGLFGGGILIRQSSPTIIDNIIVENRYCSGGGGIGVVSGSPLIEGNYIANSLQFGCSGGVGGGGIGVDGFFSPASPVIQRNVVENTSSNSAFGGGISLFGAGEAVVSSNIIRFNTGGNFGGGISVSSGAAPLIVQNLIVGNTGRTGGIEVITPWGTAGARIFSNTVAANDGFQVFLHQEPSESISHLANNVLVGTDPALFCAAGLALHDVTANNVYSGSSAAYGGACSSMLGSDGNISIDPLFVSPGTSDYRLSASSPSIDAGGASLITPPVLDLAGLPRVVDGDQDGIAVIDQGAYEFQPIPLRDCPDFTGDGVVTADDVRDLVGHLGKKRFNARYDLDEDGKVAGRDLLVVRSHLGQVCA